MNGKLPKLMAILFLVLLVNTAYIASYASPTIFYMTNVMLHLGLGLALTIALGVLIAKRPDLRRGLPVAAILFLLALLLGVFLVVRGNVIQNRWAFWSHIVVAGLGLAAFAPWVWRKAREQGGGWRQFQRGFAAALVLLVLWPLGANLWRKANPNPSSRIKNPLIVPTSMQEEGGGPQSPFFPSSAKTNVGGIIPSNFFMDSQVCGECHKDIYEQWNSSAHHFASFNNQFYRKSIEYMQDVVGTQPSKWCAGCHDHAVFFNGRFERPIKEQIDTPEAHAGLACTSCHAITHVDSSMGNGGFTIEYPPLHELAASKNPYIRALDRFLTYPDPEPHKKTFMKPFMRLDSAEFCSSCHKVHLDVPVNYYRWFRGFNDYDNWQASGVSGQGARSFYYPAETKTCAGCHMPLVDSNDPGNVDGKVHSHRFPAANTALAHVNQDEEQMEVTEKFLKSGFITVDIFAVSPVEKTGETADGAPRPARARSSCPPSPSARRRSRPARSSCARSARWRRRSTARSRCSSRARRPRSTWSSAPRAIGHFFPGGTVDAFDVWLELQARDADGRVVFWSGQVEDDGKGPVEAGAHFYRSYQLDGEGNPIDKRNAWQARSVLYVRLIPPGAADVAHYRIKIPKDARGPLTLTAKLNYRKFAHSYTQFAYAGQPKPGQDPQPGLRPPQQPGVVVRPGEHPGQRLGQDQGPDPGPADHHPGHRRGPGRARRRRDGVEADGGQGGPGALERLGDRHAAAGRPQGRRVRLQEGHRSRARVRRRLAQRRPRADPRGSDRARAKPYIQKALSIDSSLGRIHFFKAMIEKAEGDYDAALASLRTVEAKYPRDRVVLNQMARILFLKRDYKEALKVLERVTLVDPEDVQMHYTAMLCWRGLGNQEKAAREAKLFRRFKAEESAQSITAKRRMVSPEDNNERQPIHEHESVPLKAAPAPKAGTPESAVVAGG